MRRPVRVLHASRSVRGARPRFLSFCWRAVFLHRLLLALFILFYGAPWIRIQASFTLTTWSGMSYRFDLPALHFSLSLIHAFVFHETRDIPSSLCSRWNHFSVILSNIRSSPTSVEISFDFFLPFVPSRPSPFSRRVCSFCISYSPVFFVSFEASSER